MAEQVQRFRQYEYRANSNLVLTTDLHRPRNEQGTHENLSRAKKPRQEGARGAAAAGARRAAMWLKGSEALHLENKSLKKKLEAAERENRELKQSLYELTAKHGAAMLQLGRMEASEVMAQQSAEDMGQGDAQGAQHEAETAQLAQQQREAEVKNRIEPPRMTGEDGPQDSATALQFYYKYDLRGHTGAVYTVRFSPNGRLLASGSFDQTVRCWDIEKPLQQEETLCLQEHSHNVTDLSWSADSSLLLSGSYDHTVRLYDMSTGRAAGVWMVPEGAFVQSVRFSPLGLGSGLRIRVS